MGVKSTLNVHRSEALDCIAEFLKYAGDRALADVLEVLNDDMREQDVGRDCGLHNFRIIEDWESKS